MTSNTTRRELLKAAPAATALIALPAVALAEGAEDKDDRYTREEFEAGERTAREVAYYHMARAWMDRWQALGGGFTMNLNAEGHPCGVLRMIPEGFDQGAPSDAQRDDLPPHVRIVDEADHSGAVKALEGLLQLTPGLRAAVRELGGRVAFERWATEGEA